MKSCFCINMNSTWIVDIWINKKGKWASHRWGFLMGLVILAALVALGADRGGRLVFEFGTGVNPEVLKETTGGSEH